MPQTASLKLKCKPATLKEINYIRETAFKMDIGKI